MSEVEARLPFALRGVDSDLRARMCNLPRREPPPEAFSVECNPGTRLSPFSLNVLRNKAPLPLRPFSVGLGAASPHLVYAACAAPGCTKTCG